MPDYDPAVRTRILARIVGPYLVVVAAMLFAAHASLPALLLAFMQDAPLVLTAGAFTLVAGLAVIAAHHHWTGPSAIVISLIGAIAALKGASLMIVPGLGAEMSLAVARAPMALLVIAVVMLPVGLWLSFVGWVSKALA